MRDSMLHHLIHSEHDAQQFSVQCSSWGGGCHGTVQVAWGWLPWGSAGGMGVAGGMGDARVVSR